MAQFTDLPDTSTAACDPPGGSDPETIAKLCEIIEAIEDNRPVFDGDALPTPYCTPDGLPVYLCKKTDVLTGESEYEYQTVPEGSSVAVPYAGALELCEDPSAKAPQWLPICVDWCDSGLVCVTTVDGVATYGPFIDAMGVQSDTAPGPFTFGACPLVGKETRSVWLLPEDACPEFVRFETVLCYGPKELVDVGGGVLVPVADTLGVGEVLMPENTAFGKCRACPVAPADSYAADSIAGLQIVSTSCEFDCETAEFTDPTTVTVGDVTFEVPAGQVWPPSQDVFDTVDCGPDCCGELIQKDITISGPHTVLAAWTYELEDC